MKIDGDPLLEAIHPTPKKRLGGLEDPTLVLTDAFWEDLPADDAKQ
jgi:hypothetical protein